MTEMTTDFQWNYLWTVFRQFKVSNKKLFFISSVFTLKYTQNYFDLQSVPGKCAAELYTCLSSSGKLEIIFFIDIMLLHTSCHNVVEFCSVTTLFC